MVTKKAKERKIKRTCVVCGKKLLITVWPDKSYSIGYYFGKVKLPIGKGFYKKIGTSKIGKIKANIVKWVGKEKTIEYWECKKCFKTD